MDNEIQSDITGSVSTVFNNTGGPRSRVRSEIVYKSYLTVKTSVKVGYYAIDLPESVNDIEAWLLDMAEKIGWQGWEDISCRIGIPSEKLLVINEPDNEIQPHMTEKENIIRTALILSMCNNFFYLPEGPRIFTRSRLERKIKLTKINIENFYELD